MFQYQCFSDSLGLLLKDPTTTLLLWRYLNDGIVVFTEKEWTDPRVHSPCIQ